MSYVFIQPALPRHVNAGYPQSIETNAANTGWPHPPCLIEALNERPIPFPRAQRRKRHRSIQRRMLLAFIGERMAGGPALVSE